MNINTIKNFASKNKPVILVGVVTLLVFLAIIVVAQTRKPTQTANLVKVTANDMATSDTGTDGSAPYKVAQTEESTSTTTNTTAGSTAPPATPFQQIAQSPNDALKNEVQINYTANGFVPQTVTTKLSQTVRWTNQTSNPLVLRQVNYIYSEFESPIAIAPGQSYTMQMYKIGLFSYQAGSSTDFGNIFTYNQAR